MLNKQKKLLMVGILTVLAGIMMNFAPKAYAVADFNVIKAKAAYDGIYRCFNDRNLRSNGASPYYANWIFDGTKGVKSVFVNKAVKTKDAVKLPYGLTDATDNNTDCSEVLFGFSSSLSSTALKNLQNSGISVSDDALNKGLLKNDVQGTTNAQVVANYFSGSTHNGGTGSMNYKAQAADVVVGSTYEQLSYRYATGNEYSRCVGSDGMPMSPIMKRIVGVSSREVSAIVFPAVAKTNSGRTVAIEGVNYNVPAPGTGEVYTFALCDVEFKVQSGTDKNNVSYVVTSVSNGVATQSVSISAKDGKYGSFYPEELAVPHTFYDSTTGVPEESSVLLKPAPLSSGVVSESMARNSAGSYEFTWDGSGNVMYAIRRINDTNSIGYSVPGLSLNYSSLALTNQEIFDLYKYYLKTVYKVPISCEGESKYDSIRADSSARLVNWVSGKTCYAYTGYPGVNNSPRNVYGVQVGNTGTITDAHLKYNVSLDNVIATLNALRVSTLDNNETGGNADGIATQNADGASSEDMQVCYSGSGVLGWVLCPIISAVSGVGEFMWESMIEGHLIIPAEQIFVNNTGTYDAWAKVRDLGNIAFVILFLAVIFSQLTGIGIDNYGIKKILPRLIVTAIIMNLSYFICELAIDVSNILGFNFNSMLEGFARDVASANGASLFSGVTGFTFDLVLGGGAAYLFTLLNPAGTLAALAAIGFAVLGLLISMVAALFVMYLVLLVREAGVILCVVLAPIAIVCFALPNTEKIYRKWFDILKALLVVYPICGALLGAGKFAGAILAGLNEPGMKIAAMLIQVLPFFLIPTLLKNSLALLGNVGNKISNLGRNVSKRSSGALQSGIKNSERFKDWQKYQTDRTMANRAERIKSRINRQTGGDESRMSERQRNLLRKANETLQNREGQRRRDTLGASEVSYQAGLLHQQAAFSNEREKMYAENFKYESDRNMIDETLGEALAGNDAERTSAAMKELINRGGVTEAITRMENADWANMDAGVQSRVIQAMGETNVDVFKAYSKYRSSGGKYNFKDWARGADAKNENVKDASYAGHLHDNGYGAMNGYSKDEMQFIQRNFDAISSGMPEKGELAGMLGVTAVNSKDAKAQTIAETTIAEQIANGTMNVEDLGLTADMIGNMRSTTAEALVRGYMGRGLSETDAQNEVRRRLASQIQAVRQDQRIRNRTSSGVAKVFGIDVPTPQVEQSSTSESAPTPAPTPVGSQSAAPASNPTPTPNPTPAPASTPNPISNPTSTSVSSSAPNPAPRSVGNEVRRDENAEATRRLEQAAAERRQRIAEAQRNRGGITLPGERPDGQA